VSGPSLRAQQLWFARAVTTPESEAGPVSDEEAERVLTPGPRMSARERLEIYRRGYHARLIECLADDYPALAHALGEEAFDALCRAYIAAYPSELPNLNFFGRRMAELCRSRPPGDFPFPEFAADLARLEWAMVEVIHAASSAPLTLEDLRDVPPEAWAEACLLPNTAFRLLRFDYPVNSYFQAFRDGRDPAVPVAHASATVVWRTGPSVWRMDLTPAMLDVLSALAGGDSLGAALARAQPHLADLDEQEASRRVMAWFREWVQSGLFARVVVRGAPPRPRVTDT
jgi:hypothetical protein